ncbi:MAG: hypothetical protein EOL91_12555 [Actinobacteria bacterium]|nr:hypothetical protein [Actinomycetota bacterium]
MAKIKILKQGETNINSTDIWRFAMHSDYKNQKIAGHKTISITLPAGSEWLDGDYVERNIYHGLGRYVNFYAYVEHRGKGYEILGNSNPSIQVKADGFPTMATFQVSIDTDYINVLLFASGLGETLYDETFTIRIFYILDEA